MKNNSYKREWAKPATCVEEIFIVITFNLSEYIYSNKLTQVNVHKNLNSIV